jgi:hypothetical protein
MANIHRCLGYIDIFQKNIDIFTSMLAFRYIVENIDVFVSIYVFKNEFNCGRHPVWRSINILSFGLEEIIKQLGMK